jgi:hypothetical protein
MDDNGDFPNGRWWQRNNPINGYDWTLDYTDATNQLSLKQPVRLKWWDYVFGPTMIVPGPINVLNLKQ